MRFHLLPIISILLTGALVMLSGPVQADITLNVGARLSTDNNVNGSPDTPNKTNQRSDSYLSLNASAVYYTPLNTLQTSYFIGQIGAFSSTYNKYENLDSSMLVGSVGLYQQLSPTWSGQITGRGFIRDTEQHERDSDGFGGTFELKKQLTQTLWVKGVVDYEDNVANLRSYSYTGKTLGVNLGYLPLKDTFLVFGYSHNARDFESTAPFNTTTQTLFFEASQRLSEHWYLSGGYAYMDNDSNYAGTAYTNQVWSAGVSFSY